MDYHVALNVNHITYQARTYQGSLAQLSFYLNLDSPCVYTSEAGEATRHVREVVLVLEYVLCLGPDPIHLGPVSQIGLVTHDEGQGQQRGNGCRLLGPEMILLEECGLQGDRKFAVNGNISG